METNAMKTAMKAAWCAVAALMAAKAVADPWDLASEAYVDRAVTNALAGATGGLATREYVGEVADALAVKVAGKADAAEVSAVASDLSSVASSVSAVWEQVFGESVWIAVTNYMRSTDAKPSMGLWERRDGQTNLVWSSAEEIGAKVDELRAETTNAVAAARSAADSARAWGKFQSADGSAAPDGFTTVSTPYLMLTGGGKWEQRTVEGGGSYWLFCGSASLGGTDETFRMMDSNGESVFEVTQGSVKEVPAIPTSFKVERRTTDSGNEAVHVAFGVYATAAPTLYYAEDVAGPWNEFYYQGWSSVGESGYTINFDMLPPLPRVFFKAVYETGAESVVDFKRPLKLSCVAISNTVYRVSVGTMSDGTKFLKLEDE